MKKPFHHVPRSLCWGVFFGLALFAVGLVFAGSTQIPSKNTGSTLTAKEFNIFVETLTGIYNNAGDVGIGVEPTEGVKLSVNGMMRVKPRATSTCNSGETFKGLIYFDSTDKHFYVCRGSASDDWMQLDN